MRRKRAAAVVAAVGVGVCVALPGTAAARSYVHAAVVPAVVPPVTVTITPPAGPQESVGNDFAVDVVSWSD